MAANPPGLAPAEGILEILVEDHAKFARTRHFLKTADGRIELQFKGKPPGLRAGSKLRVKGTQSGNVMELNTTDATAITVTAVAPVPNTVGEQKVAVLLVNFIDDTSQPYTVAQANDVVFNQTSSFLKENSFQRTWLAGITSGWLTLPIARTCDGIEIASRAYTAAINAGIDLSSYSKFMYVFPYNAACGWYGSATLGGSTSNLWVNGKLELRVLGHEFGHTLGLYHAHALECGTTTLGASCTTLEYGDTVDIMGNNVAGHYDAFNKERLGWLNTGAQPPITTVQANGTYVIDAYAASGIQPKALKILKSIDPASGISTWYYIEYRAPVGYDAVVSSFYGSNIASGVVVRIGTDGDANTSSMLDMTPDSSFYTDWFDVALAFGQSYSDAASGVIIAPIAGNGSSAQIGITLNRPAACTHANPTVAVVGGGQSVAAGTSVSYSVSVTNNDSSACRASTFNLQSVVPAGWGAGFANASLTLSPASAAITMLNVVSTTTALPGSYALGVTALNAETAGYAASGSASYSIPGAALSASVATNQASYKLGETVSASAKVSAGSGALANVAVTFVFTKPNGTTVTKTATTDGTGVARTSYRLARKDPGGAWQLKGSSIYAGASASATSGFAVQ